jgi:hypothetical protein
LINSVCVEVFQQVQDVNGPNVSVVIIIVEFESHLHVWGNVLADSSLFIINFAITYSLYYEVEPIDINLKQFLFPHCLNKQLEKSNRDFLYIDSKNRLKSSLHGKLINIESEDVILAFNWNI